MAGDLFRLEKSKHPADALNAGSQHIYLLLGIIQTERSTYSSLNPHTNHQRLSTMMPGTYGHAQTVKQRTHIDVYKRQEFSRASVLNTGVDKLIYPFTRSFTVGAQLTF